MAAHTTLLHVTCLDYPDLQRLISMLPAIPISVRKGVMTLCRTQQSPYENDRIRRALSPIMQYQSTYLHHGRNIEYHFELDILPIILAYIRQPLFLGFISMCLRCIPIQDETEAKELLEDGIQKEIESITGTNRVQTLDYSCLFGGTDDIHQPLNKMLPPRPELSLSLRYRLQAWKMEMSRQLHYPTFSRTKTVGHVTESNFRSAERIGWGSEEAVTTLTLERRYSSTGLETYGPCEVRTAWKYNDLKPRVYYAIGGTTYFASRYIRSFSNSLCDLLPSTRRSTRYSTSRLTPISDTQSVVIYDYSSFTSNLTELKYFIDELARYCDDTTVTLVDTHRGLTEVLLGDLLRDYNSVVNFNAEMDVSRVFDVPHGHRPLILTASRNGMLGVYGNIVLSTFLHGILLTHIVGSEDLCNAVGDDAIGVPYRHEWSMPDILEAIRLIGDVAQEKQESWVGEGTIDETHGWQFLKRPLDRIANHLFVGVLFDLPLCVYVEPPRDDHMHTQELGSFSSRCKAFIMQSCRLLDRLHLREDRTSEEEIDFALHYLTTCYRRLHLPTRGALPPLYHPRFEEPLHVALPIIARESISKPWHLLLIEEFQGQSFTIPRHSFVTMEPERFFSVEQSFLATSDRLLNLAVDLGWAKKELNIVYLVMTPETGRAFTRFLEGDHSLVYTYTYLERPSSWWIHTFDAIKM